MFILDKCVIRSTDISGYLEKSVRVPGLQLSSYWFGEIDLSVFFQIHKLLSSKKEMSI